MALERGRSFGMVAVGLTAVFAASSAGMPPASGPLPPPLPVAAPTSPSALPPASPVPPPEPLVLPSVPTPLFPDTSVKPPAPQPEPTEPEITEPVATIHRFAGRYLGGDAHRTLSYVPKITGAEIRSRPLASAIPAADEGSKDDAKRIEVPTGRAVWHNGRVFLTTKRELWVIDPECRVDWTFTLPGKPDNGETLLGVSGFYEGKVVVASQHSAPGSATGHVFTFDAASGRQLGFATIKGGFDSGAHLALDAPHGTLLAVTAERYQVYELATGEVRWTARIPRAASNSAVSNGIVFTTAPEGVGMPGRGSYGFEVLARGATGTAPARFVAGANGTGQAYLPIRSGEGAFILAAYTLARHGNSVNWSARVPRSITTAPVVHGQSAYFVAGNTVYRVNTATGVVCWKQTIALNANETLTELTFADGELRASGTGLLVRIANRVEAAPTRPVNADHEAPGSNTPPPK